MIGTETITGSVRETENLSGSLTGSNSLNGSVNNSGTLIQAYTLPVASANTLGGIKVGANLSIEADGTLNATASSNEGGTTDYIGLTNKPRINNVELTGNKTLEQLGIQAKGDYAKTSDIPTKTSQLTNDSGYLTGVPSEYITEAELNEKGYLTEHQDISNLATKDELHSHSNKSVLDNISQTTINNWNAKSDFSGSYNDLTNKPTIPTKVSQLTNDSSYASESYVTNAIANAQLGGGDTEIDLSGYATKDDLANKVDKVTGKSLIADSEITRLASVTNYDDTEIKNTLKTKADTSSIPTKVSQLSNDKGYLTSVPSEYITETELNAKGFLTGVPSEYVTETELNNKGYLKEHQDISNLATKDELHSHSNKTVLDNISQSNIDNWNEKSITKISGNVKVNDLEQGVYISDSNTTLLYCGETSDQSGYVRKGSLVVVTWVSETQKSVSVIGYQGGFYRMMCYINTSSIVYDIPLTEKELEYYLPTKTSDLTNDSGFLTSIPGEYVTESEMNDAISNLGGGTGNVSSDIVNSIMVVDELPETEVEGILYLVKENTEEGVNILPNLPQTSELNTGVTASFTGTDTNIILDGTATESYDRCSWKFDLNLEHDKNYMLKAEIISGTVDATLHDNELSSIKLRGYTDSSNYVTLLDEDWIVGDNKKYIAFVVDTDYVDFCVVFRQKSDVTYNDLVVKFTIYEV